MATNPLIAVGRFPRSISLINPRQRTGGYMRAISWAAVVIVIIGLGLIQPLAAQTTTGALVGDIVDSSGARLPGVTIKVVSQQTGAARDTISNELGSYRFNALM